MVANASEDRSESAKNMLKLSTGMTDEDFDELNMKDGLMLQKVVGEINGLNDDFLQETLQTNA